MFEKHACEMVKEGVAKYPGRMFRVPRLGWTVVLNGRRWVDELRGAPEEEMSFFAATEEFTQMRYTLGPNIVDGDHAHVEVVRNELTKNIGACFDDIYDEIRQGFGDSITFEEGQEWSSIPAFAMAISIIARATNRVFVGLPLCRDPAFLHSNIELASNVMKTAQWISVWPEVLRPLVGTVMSPYKKFLSSLSDHIGAIVAQRIDEDKVLGVDREDRPNDAISWLLNHYAPGQAQPDAIVVRILGMNFVALHTSTNAFTHALYQLASQPEYIAPLRAEVEEVIAREGWSKSAMRDMHKIDSFLRESGRVSEGDCLVMNRKVVKDGGYTFSDGTTLPKGTLVSVAMPSVHLNADVYPDPETFDAFRFSRMREEDSMKYQTVSTDCDFIPFGHGRHACPGRFFAVNELKAMLAHVVLHYDVQLDGGSRTKPRSEYFGDIALANTAARVLFRKRVE